MSKEVTNLLERVKKGFAGLDLAEKYKTSALDWIERWLSEELFIDYVPQIEHLIETQKWAFLLDSFYQIIPFGTGGRRGLVGIGPNRINPWTIQASAQGHSQYLAQLYGEDAKIRGVVLTYDVRKFTQRGIYNDQLPNPIMDIGCRQLAVAAASVYAANGLRVWFFEDVRSTPELSFAIRHLNAVAGDMFSASHNLPTDNGKKVYDNFGGQLIPPHDQALVDEVTRNVTDIDTMDFDTAVEKGLVRYIGAEVDAAYHKAVRKISLSDARDIKILYSPLHGTGLTSVYPILTQLGFDVTLDDQTANLSGGFENVTFNIPNPEVVQSFDTALKAADRAQAEIVLSSDPDADRIGVMVRHTGKWEFLTGNEIGIILVHFAIQKYKDKGKLTSQNLVIKTAVTTSLIEKIAQKQGIQCIGDLLVGFKYIGEEMNRLEKAGRIDDFIFGTEESHGFLMGNYCRDKDAAGAAVWIAELASELKESGRTLVDYLGEIYAQYGYCHNYLTEIRMLGAKGMEKILSIMAHLRDTDIAAFGEFAVNRKTDRWQGQPDPHLSKTDTSARNVIVFQLAPTPETQSITLTVRPSGTEPKIKMYVEVVGRPYAIEEAPSSQTAIVALRQQVEKSVMQYCYDLLGIDFPERGYLLFWQLPLDSKLKYFEIEDKITILKSVEDQQTRQDQLDGLLSFLGANPVEKVDDAFKARFGAGILSYLNLAAP